MADTEEVPLVDAHCHLELYQDPTAAVLKARAAGVRAIITAGSDFESNKKMSALTDIEGVFGVVGVHPESAAPDSLSEELEALVKGDKRIVGIGETGLDAKAAESGKMPLEVQEELFSRQLDLAVKLRLPVVIHARGLLQRAEQMLYDKGVERAMFHFFSGDENDALRLEKKGYIISIPPLESGRLKRVIKAADLGSLVTETDGPFVGKEPEAVKGILRKISEFKGIGLEDAAERITETLKEYFGLRI